jgi:hypothetical protein
MIPFFFDGTERLTTKRSLNESGASYCTPNVETVFVTIQMDSVKIDLFERADRGTTEA